MDKEIKEEIGNIKNCGYIDDKEPEYPHIIEKLKPKVEYNFLTGGYPKEIYPDNKELMNKINEIIKVVNIMNRGGRK